MIAHQIFEASLIPGLKGALSSQPKNFNFLSPLNFTFILKRAPNTNYDVHRINLPGIALPHTMYATPDLALPQAGDHLEFAPLVVQYKVDEDFNNYLELFDWMVKGLGRIPNTEEFKRFRKQPYWAGEAEKSEIILTILDSARQVNIVVNFHDAFPTNMTELVFDAQIKGDIPYITATVQFMYSFYTIDRPE